MEIFLDEKVTCHVWENMLNGNLLGRFYDIQNLSHEKLFSEFTHLTVRH
jgi:hypothetical protein